LSALTKRQGLVTAILAAVLALLVLVGTQVVMASDAPPQDAAFIGSADASASDALHCGAAHCSAHCGAHAACLPAVAYSAYAPSEREYVRASVAIKPTFASGPTPRPPNES
jgi:hypothetical protein